MPGRHAINRDVALSALNSPAGRGLAAAMAVGTMFGVALPTASADDNGSDKAFGGRVTDLSTADSSKNTTWPRPNGTVNRDFTRMLFDSNWNSMSTNDVDAYLVEIPSGAVPASSASQ